MGRGSTMNLSFIKDYRMIDRIAYRGDSRSPEVIFREGFWNKHWPEFVWPAMILQDFQVPGLRVEIKNIEELVDAGLLTESDFEKSEQWVIPPLAPQSSHKKRYRVQMRNHPEKTLDVKVSRTDARHYLYQRYISNRPQYRDEEYARVHNQEEARHDINPVTAICLALRADVAPYFPINEKSKAGDWIWIYAVRLYTGVETYKVQREKGSELAFAEEVAVERVPPSHVLCAIRCWRIGKYPDMQFNLLPRIWWNPHAWSYEIARSRNKIIRDFSPLQAHRVQCPNSESETEILGKELLLEGTKQRAKSWAYGGGKLLSVSSPPQSW